MFFGIGTERATLVVLGALGLMAGVWRFAMWLDSEHALFLVQFVVLALGGLGILAAGYMLDQRRECIRELLRRFLLCSWWTVETHSLEAQNESPEQFHLLTAADGDGAAAQEEPSTSSNA